MASFPTALRRSLWLVLIAAAVGAMWSWRRNADDASSPAPAEWPPLAPITPGGTSAEESAASIVNALVDAPEARSTDAASNGWSEPLADGSCPVGYPVKANDNSGIFHMPGGRFYDRTKAERCYSDAATATADGYRRAKN